MTSTPSGAGRAPRHPNLEAVYLTPHLAFMQAQDTLQLSIRQRSPRIACAAALGVQTAGLQDQDSSQHFAKGHED